MIYDFGCYRCMKSWSPLTFVFFQWSVSSLSTGLTYWTWRSVGKWLTAWQGHYLLIHNILCCGAPNLIMRYYPTYFRSIRPPWCVWLMNRTRWHSWIWWVNGLYIWLSQSELLLWIQIWIWNPPILGKSQSTWTWSGCTWRFQVTQKFPCCRSWDGLRRRYQGFTGKGLGDCRMVLLPWFIVLDLDLSLEVRDVKIEVKVLVDYIFLDFFAAWFHCNMHGYRAIGMVV